MNRSNRGQALAEFALILPLMLMITLGVLDIGRVVWALDSVSNAAREGARCAIVSGTGNPFKPSAAGCSQTPQERAVAKALSVGGTPSVTVCYSLPGGPACTGNTNAPGASNSPGALVTVRVEAQPNLLTTSLLGISSFSVSGSSTMLVHN